MELLPDDELLAVLGYLTARELMLCRTVCRRWRSLALHPLLWCKKALDIPLKPLGGRHSRPLAAVALRLAPRLDCMTMASFEESVDSLGSLLTSTSCAITKVVVTCQPRDAAILAMFFNRQASLGRLNDIHLTVSGTNVTKDVSSKLRLRALLHQLVHMPGLVCLSVRLDLSYSKLPTLEKAAQAISPVPASLRRLKYMEDFVDPYLHLYLNWHAPTLQTVFLMAPVPEAATLLSAMPLLRELHCPILPGMIALLCCPALKTLHLEVTMVEVTGKPRQELAEAAAFLRAAVARLENLVLDYEYLEERADAVNLVLSLRGPTEAGAALRSLVFLLEDHGPLIADQIPPLQLRPLAAILPQLPQLTKLDLGGALSADFLEALADRSAVPQLQVLWAIAPMEYCSHRWAHSDQARTLMSAKPRLHICLFGEMDGFCDDCDFCPENQCHFAGVQACTVFSHPRGAACGVSHEYEMHIDIE